MIRHQTQPIVDYPAVSYAFLPGSNYSALIELPNTPIKLTISDTVKTVGLDIIWTIDTLELPRVDIAKTLYQLYANSSEYLPQLFPEDGTALQKKLLSTMLADQSIVNKYAAILLGLSEYISLQPQAN